MNERDSGIRMQQVLNLDATSTEHYKSGEWRRGGAVTTLDSESGLLIDSNSGYD